MDWNWLLLPLNHRPGGEANTSKQANVTFRPRIALVLIGASVFGLGLTNDQLSYRPFRKTIFLKIDSRRRLRSYARLSETMKTDFKVTFFLSLLATAVLTQSQFSNLLGTVYRKGNLLFTPDGNCLLSPVGNKVTVFDLVQYVRSLACYGILVGSFELTQWPC